MSGVWAKTVELRVSSSLTSAAVARLSGFLHIHPQGSALEGLAVEAGDGRARLVAFHFHESETAACAGEDIRVQFEGAHPAVLGKKREYVFFRRIGGQVAH